MKAEIATVAAALAICAAFVAGGVTGKRSVAPAHTAAAAGPRLTIYLASIIWKGPEGGLNTAAVFCSAASRDEAAEKMAATFKVKFPGAAVVSLIANPIEDELIEEVCASRHSLQ